MNYAILRDFLHPLLHRQFVKSQSARASGDLPQRTFAFACRVVKLCRFLDDHPGISRTSARQLLRSASSIGANVEEGQGSQSRADFIAKYSIACKEARETHYWLRLIAGSELTPADRIKELTDEANQLIAILTTIVRRTRANTREAREAR